VTDRRTFVSLALAQAALTATGTAHAQAATSWPTRPVRMLMPFAPGSGFDTIVRHTCGRLGEELGQPFIVENMPGGGGIIATQTAARATPDGYTMIFQSLSTAVILAAAYTKLPYDPIGDFRGVAGISQYPMIMVTHPDVPAKTLREFIALLKANPGKFSYGSSGIGTGQHLGVELFKTMAGVDITHIPYKGTAPAATDLLANRIQLLMEAVPSSITRVTAGQFRPLAVTTLKRSMALPDVPTADEAGVPGFELPFWNGIFAPAATPRPILEKLAAACTKVLRDPATIARLKELGAEDMGMTLEPFEKYWKEQIALYRKVVATSGVKLEMN
jgi:tripartite-type tricarboxylate transporter receptor subunit TctC